MTPTEILNEIQGAKLTISVVGERLRVYPLEAVTGLLKVQIKENKEAILRELLVNLPGICSVCRKSLFWRGTPILYTDGTSGSAPWVCGTCHPPPFREMVFVEYQGVKFETNLKKGDFHGNRE